MEKFHHKHPYLMTAMVIVGTLSVASTLIARFATEKTPPPPPPAPPVK